MEIGLDMMGGDFAPLEAIKGVKRFLDHAPQDVHLVLIGDEKKISSAIASEELGKGAWKVVHASEVIGMNEHPTHALKEKTHSSINIGFHLLQQNKIDAFISAGNTGAMMVGMHYFLKPIPGIQRPTISTLLPRVDNPVPTVLLDVGINVDSKPESLLQFAILGSLYSEFVLHNPIKPRVALLNIGEEEAKGNKLAQSTYPLLKESKKLNFLGNLEGRDIFTNKADVIVCDGFTGNVVLKLSESFYDIVCSRNLHDDYLDLFNYEKYGGTPVLGVSEPVVIGHGISKAPSFQNMIEVAEKIIRTRFLDEIRKNFAPE